MLRREKKGGMGFSAKMVTEDVEGIEGVAEGAGHLFGGTALDQVSAQSLVLAVFRQAGFQEEAAECTYLFWCADSHIYRMSHTICGVKSNCGHNLLLPQHSHIYSTFDDSTALLTVGCPRAHEKNWPHINITSAPIG